MQGFCFTDSLSVAAQATSYLQATGLIFTCLNIFRRPNPQFFKT